ncbi:hypothetical protein CDL15_Pgr002721 [Punica granatum]|uniref:Extensin-like n=1 Tax=Punica granatum TaxID=22663 RepID=A0A218XHH9_PUNGR|nr:hypothetical protein CDL15_Pgr002721 [Punica granatum]
MPPRLPALHPPSPPKPKVPSKRPCTRSYGPSGRSEIGSVASLLIPTQRSRTTGSFRFRCELVDSRAEVADYRELQTELTRARARVAHLDREMARLSAELDRVLKRARNLAHFLPSLGPTPLSNGHRAQRDVGFTMAEGDHVDVSEEVNPSVPTLSQPPQTHAPPPLTLAGVLPAYSGAPPTHLPPPTSSGAPLPPASLTSAATDDQARITALEGTVNQMAANMAELLALLRGPNRASSSSTPPPGQGPTVDPAPGIPLTQAPENVDAPAPPILHTSMAQPFTSPYPPPSAPTAVPLPPAAFLTSDQVLSAPPPVSMPAPAAAYTVPPPTVFPTSGVHIRPAQENEELNNWTSVLCYSAVIADV